MNPLQPQEPVPAVPGYYTCRLPEPGLTIRFSLEALDGILAEVMTGFGAIPRRGAEVGGILLGRTEGGEVWIEDFAAVACEHRRGPSYLLSDHDREAFVQTFGQDRNRDHFPVGLFRSNTRDQNTITDEDRALFTEFFPPPAGVFLLVRPYATKTGAGAFLAPRGGMLPDSTEDVFPFSRWELEGGTAPRRRPLSEPRPHANTAAGTDPVAVPSPVAPPPTGAPRPRAGAARAAVTVPAEEDPGGHSTGTPALEGRNDDPVFAPALAEPYQRRRRGWVWIPLSFIFLLLGVLLGFQSAIGFYPRPGAVDASAFALGLSATGKEDSLHIRWNRESPAIKSAERGRLEIKDGSYSKTVDLDASSLQTGSVMYPPLSANVSLRFQVTIKENTAVVETLDWAKDRSR
jgi:hypothetical protein